MRKLWIVAVTAVTVLAAVTAFALTRQAASATAAAWSPNAAEPAAAAMPFQAGIVKVSGDTFLSWALMDRRTGQIWGSSTMDQTSWTASMIKAWLAADYLRRTPAPSSDMLNTIEIMIRDSDNDAASAVYALDGGDSSIDRLISTCGLTDSSPNPGNWATTNLSARDSVRMGDCIASGKGAGPQWTNWLLTQMRNVHGDGDFGIRDALPAAQAGQVAIKNGWEDFDADGLYHVNCLAIGDTWTMAVMQQYKPQSTWDADFALGTQRCTAVAKQLLAGN
jgi:hypothetical protein